MIDGTAGKEALEDEWHEIEPSRVEAGGVRRLSRQQAKLWSLVLDSRGVPCCLEQREGRLCIVVPAWHLEAAYEELRGFEEKNRNWPVSLPLPRPMVENGLVTISVLILLAAFHNITRLDITVVDGFPIDWLHIGSAEAGRILDGEAWRLVTALTLHSDAAHLLSNLGIGGVFVFLLCRELGSGLAWTLLLAAGVTGNLCNALIRSGAHNSVGASTAVFGAVGILAALSLVRYRHHLQQRWPLPVASALALLAILGTEGQNTDLGAHLFGFLAGIAAGLVTEFVIDRRGQPSRILNALLAIFSGLIVLTAWMIAVATG